MELFPIIAANESVVIAVLNPHLCGKVMHPYEFRF